MSKNIDYIFVYCPFEYNIISTFFCVGVSYLFIYYLSMTIYCILSCNSPDFLLLAGSWPSICPEIIQRARWGARMATEIEYALVPIQYVIVHHTVTNICETEKSCSELNRNIQNFHMEDMEFHDIGYK